MSKLILGKHIGFITAHPDDEALLAGGTIYQNHIMGGKSSLYCATLGEQGTAYFKNELSMSEIKNVRKSELLNAGRFLRIKTIEHDNFPDKGIVDHASKVRSAVLAFVLKYKPEILISFGADGFTGHSDHIIIGKITKEIARELHISFFAFSKPPRSLYPDFDDHLLKKRKQGSYEDNSFKSKMPTIKIQVDPIVKLAVLRLYASQFEGLDPYRIFPKVIADHILSNEYFIEE